MTEVDLYGKTAIVTGSNTGIGKETARELARRGARVILACRDPTRAEDARQELIRSTNNQEIVVGNLDLASLKSVKEFAENIYRTETRLDILVNNAGIWSRERKNTTDGYELHFGVNHLGHFYLTNLLLDLLKVSIPSRIVIVSSDAHKIKGVNFSDLEMKRMKYSSFLAYAQSKTANILCCIQLSKLLEALILYILFLLISYF